jgi:hypothetical protein
MVVGEVEFEWAQMYKIQGFNVQAPFFSVQARMTKNIALSLSLEARKLPSMRPDEGRVNFDVRAKREGRETELSRRMSELSKWLIVDAAAILNGDAVCSL